MKYVGLNENEVLELKKKFGDNVLPTKEGRHWFFIFLAQFKNPLVYILLIVSIISFFLREYIDASLVGVVILVNSFMGFFQEYNAQKTLVALKNILKPKTMVMRNGIKVEIDVRQLVPKDIVFLSSGDRIPADGKLIEGTKLLVNEAILTGEEEAVGKIPEKEKNLLFMGTIVVSGKGIMEVTKIGKETEMGKIGESLSEIKEEKTPLQLKLEKFTHNLAIIILLVCFIVFWVGIAFNENILEMLKMSVILSIAAIPEGLPIAITVILALGMRRILKKNGLVKNLLSIETLGATSVICTDKTGTLTKGIMKVERVDFADEKKALLALALTNEQKTNSEIAIWNYLREEKNVNPQEIIDSARRIYEEPFDSEKKYSLTINDIALEKIAFVLGAPEIILSFCKVNLIDKGKILNEIENFAEEGLRVLGIAYKEKGDLREKNDYLWLGLIGIKDPLREEVKESIILAQEAGIKIKIVTGDYRKTAEKVAFNLGFKLKEKNIMEGQELEKISGQDLKERIDDIVLFTRVTPHQKMKIVKALQDRGEVVAMTGDGVNDAPALKKADIGVVVGSACDVAKEAGDLILLDGNFKTIVAACEEGRLIFSNIKKVVGYVLSNSFAEIVLIFGAILLRLPAPLTILQILWIHLICDGPADIFLGFEPKEKAIMKKKPKDIQKESILSSEIKFLIIAISLTSGLMTLFFFRYFYKTLGDINLARTIVFAALAINSMVYVFAFKNLKKIIIKTENFFQNKYLFWGVAYGFLLVFAAIYLPQLNRILDTIPLNISQWLLVFSVAIVTTFWVELVKIIDR